MVDTDTPAPVHTMLNTNADDPMLGHTRIPCIFTPRTTVESIPCTLTPRIAHMLKLLQTPSHENLAHVLLFPVVRKQRVSDGVQEVGPVRINSTLQMLEDALMLVQKARHDAGHGQEQLQQQQQQLPRQQQQLLRLLRLLLLQLLQLLRLLLLLLILQLLAFIDVCIVQAETE